MIPPYPEQIHNPAERVVHRQLQEAPDDWVVIHSLRIPKHVTQQEGEADFVILVPDLGVLVLEVKGGKPRRDRDGIWWLGDKPMKRRPLDQALRNMHSLRDDVEDRPELTAVNFAAAVCLPKANNKDGTIFDWRAWEHISISHLVEGIQTALRESATQRTYGRPQLTSAQLSVLATRWRQPVVFYDSLETQQVLIDQELKRLTTAQDRTLRAAAENPRILVTGSAGAGKTVVAIESCKRALLSGHRVLFCCYNGLLAKRLATEFNASDDDLSGKLWVGKLHDYMLKVIGQRPLPEELDEFPKREDKGDYYDRALPFACAEKLSEASHTDLFDMVIVDEAQDIVAKDIRFDNYLSILAWSVKGGLSDGRWLMFADFDQQSLYNASSSEVRSHFESYIPKGFTRHTLLDNCRNRPTIVQRVSKIVATDGLWEDSLRVDDETDAKFVYFKGQRDQIRKLGNLLNRARNEGYRDSDIVILHPSLEEPAVRGLKTADPSRWAMRIDSMRSNQEGKITHASIRRFKGMEARFVVITDIDCQELPDYRQQLYTAMTRSTDRVVVLAHEDSRRLLEP